MVELKEALEVVVGEEQEEVKVVDSVVVQGMVEDLELEVA